MDPKGNNHKAAGRPDGGRFNRKAGQSSDDDLDLKAVYTRRRSGDRKTHPIRHPAHAGPGPGQGLRHYETQRHRLHARPKNENVPRTLVLGVGSGRIGL